MTDNEDDVATSPTVDSTPLTSIANMLEEHRASISADFKTSFATLEARLDMIQTTITEHGQWMNLLESHAELQERYQTKELIIREARKQRGKLHYRRSPVQIFEDYKPEVAEEWAKYRSVMADLYNLALRPTLLFPAPLQITLESCEKKRFSSPEEATSFVGKYQQTPGPV